MDGDPVIVESVGAILSIYDSDRAMTECRIEGRSGEYGDKRYGDLLGRGREERNRVYGHDGRECQYQYAAGACVHARTIIFLDGEMQARPWGRTKHEEVILEVYSLCA